MYTRRIISSNANEQLLINAIKLNDINTITNLIAQNQTTQVSIIDLDSFTSQKGYTALHLAVEHNKPEIINCILKIYPNLHAKLCNDNQRKYTALHLASMKGFLACVEALIANNADIHCRDNLNFTPLMYAAFNSNSEIVRKLIQELEVISFDEIQTCFNQLDIQNVKILVDILVIKNKKGETAISHCIKNKLDESLYSFYANKNALRDNERNTFLHLLLEKGEEVDVINFLNILNSHNTPKKVKPNPKEEVDDITERFKNKLNLQDSENQTRMDVYLFLGGGDLSFELSFLKKHQFLGKSMIVTTYENEIDFKSREYSSRALKNRSELIKCGAVVWHGVDATQLHEYDFLKDKHPTRIYFSHPLAGTTIGGKRDTGPMLKNFFISATSLQKPGDKILIARRKNDANKGSNNGYYKGLYQFHVFSQDLNFKYKVIKKHKFSTKRYPGYSHVTTSKDASTPYEDNSSIEYVFEKRDRHLIYNSDFEEDSNSDTEESQIEPNPYLENRNRQGQTLLHLAVKVRKEKVVKKLLQLGAAPNTIDSVGMTPLFYSIEIDELKLATKISATLIKFGADINYVSSVSGLGTPFEFLLQSAFPPSQHNKTKVLKAKAIIKLFIQFNPDIVEKYKNPNNLYNHFLFDICTDSVRELKKKKDLYYKRLLKSSKEKKNLRVSQDLNSNQNEIPSEEGDDRLGVLEAKLSELQIEDNKTKFQHITENSFDQKGTERSDEEVVVKFTVERPPFENPYAEHLEAWYDTYDPEEWNEEDQKNSKQTKNAYEIQDAYNNFYKSSDAYEADKYICYSLRKSRIYNEALIRYMHDKICNFVNFINNQSLCKNENSFSGTKEEKGDQKKRFGDVFKGSENYWKEKGFEYDEDLQLELAISASLEDSKLNLKEQKEHLNSLGLGEVKDVPGDGFCLFHAVAHQIREKGINVNGITKDSGSITTKDIIELIDNYLQENWNNYQDSLIGNTEDEKYAHLLDQLERYLKLGNYAQNIGDLMPKMLSDALGVNIVIHDAITKQESSFNKSQHQLIRLGRVNNNHYVVITNQPKKKENLEERQELNKEGTSNTQEKVSIEKLDLNNPPFSQEEKERIEKNRQEVEKLKQTKISSTPQFSQQQLNTTNSLHQNQSPGQQSTTTDNRPILKPYGEKTVPIGKNWKLKKVV